MAHLQVTIRNAEPEDAEGIACVHVKAWQESYKEILPEDFLTTISYSNRLKLRKEILAIKDITNLRSVAEYKGKIIGFCDAGKSRQWKKTKGEIYAIYLLDEFKGQGIGKALWHRSIQHLIKHQLIPFSVLVLKDNRPARKFYERQGGVVAGMEQTEIAGKFYDEVRYVFEGVIYQQKKILKSIPLLSLPQK